MADERFEGFPTRECGEHRTLGERAWCHDCTEYCYPLAPCRGCELPGLRAERDTLLRAARVLVRALDDTGRLHATTGGPELAALVDIDPEQAEPMSEGPGGYVVITFAAPPSEVCTWPACPMSAEWFPDDESATRYLARLPAWTDPHRLPVSDLAHHRQERERDDHRPG